MIVRKKAPPQCLNRCCLCTFLRALPPGPGAADNIREMWIETIALRIVSRPPKSYAHNMDDRQDDGLIASTPSSRVIQEYVPGRQVTIANIIANPDRMLCRRVGLETVEAIGMMTITPGESAIIAGDIAVKAADVEIGFLDRFSGTLVITGRLSSVELALEAANRGLQEILGFYPARITRT